MNNETETGDATVLGLSALQSYSLIAGVYLTAVLPHLAHLSLCF